MCNDGNAPNISAEREKVEKEEEGGNEVCRMMGEEGGERALGANK